MTYIELINQFWQTNRHESFSKTETYLYFILLNECNARNWENPFECSNKSIMGNYDMNKDTLINARNKLKQKGLIDFEAGKRKEKSPLYTLLNSKNKSKTTTKSASKTTTKSTSKSANSLYKTKIEIENKEREEKKITPPEHSIFDKFKNTLATTLSECYNAVVENESYLEVVAMNNKLGSVEKAKEWLNAFLMQLQNEGVEEKSVNDFKSHFARWLSIQLKNEKSNTHTGGSNFKPKGALVPLGGSTGRKKDYSGF